MGTWFKANRWIRKSRATNLSQITLSVNAAWHIPTKSNYEENIQIKGISLHNFEISQTKIMTKFFYKFL